MPPTPSSPSAPFPPLDELLPHRPPMRLLDEVLGWDGTSARCAATIGATHPFLRAGGVPAVVLLEVMAQTAGVAGALRARDDRAGRPDLAVPRAQRSGFIVRVSRMELAVESLGLGDLIEATAWREAIAPPLAIYEARAYRLGPDGPRELAAATLSVYQAAS